MAPRLPVPVARRMASWLLAPWTMVPLSTALHLELYCGTTYKAGLTKYAALPLMLTNRLRSPQSTRGKRSIAIHTCTTILRVT